MLNELTKMIIGSEEPIKKSELEQIKRTNQLSKEEEQFVKELFFDKLKFINSCSFINYDKQFYYLFTIYKKLFNSELDEDFDIWAEYNRLFKK